MRTRGLEEGEDPEFLFKLELITIEVLEGGLVTGVGILCPAGVLE